MKITSLTFFAMTLLGLLGCHYRQNDFEYFITNKSNDTLIFKEWKYLSDTVVRVIYPQEDSKYVGIIPFYTEAKKLTYCPCQDDVFFLAPQNPNKSLTKSIYETSNWSKDLVKARFMSGLPDYSRCYFEVNSADIK